MITMFADCDYDICLAADKAHSSSRSTSIYNSHLEGFSNNGFHCGGGGCSEIMVILIIDAAIQICNQTEYSISTKTNFSNMQTSKY